MSVSLSSRAMKLEFAYVLEQLEQERKSAQSFVLTRKRLSSVRGARMTNDLSTPRQ